MRRKIFALFVVAVMLLSIVPSVFSGEFDSMKKGSISVTLAEQYEKTPISGAELSLYYVATVSVNNKGNLSYEYVDHFADSSVALDDPQLSLKLSALVSDENAEAEKKVTDEKGSAVWSDLELGLYLICQTGAVDGYATISPFLITVPASGADNYVYDVNASPKTEVARLTAITIKKVWNTDASVSAAEKVTVQLLQNGRVVKTAVLSEENDWQVSYADMPESDTYSVKEVDIPKGFTATYKQEGYVFTVINTSTLIQTGQNFLPIPILALCGIALISAGILILRKKGRNDA